jgi:hypothetical protein
LLEAVKDLTECLACFFRTEISSARPARAERNQHVHIFPNLKIIRDKTPSLGGCWGKAARNSILFANGIQTSGAKWKRMINKHGVWRFEKIG